MAKRAFDIFFSCFGVALLMPVFVLAALAVKLDSPGPVFFRQIRVGQFGRPFEILKFRTMRHSVHQPGPLITSGKDPRITRVGWFLRNTKIDELPQLFNVLLGDMSLVGPRPEVRRYVDLYTAQERNLILSVRPGITDETSIEFRDEEKILAAARDPEKIYIDIILPRKLELYANYATSNSVLGDLRIIVKTLCTVMRLT